MTATLKTKVEKTRLGYRGRVYCQLTDGTWLWSESHAHNRLTRKDAKLDALWLKEQHERANQTNDS